MPDPVDFISLNKTHPTLPRAAQGRLHLAWDEEEQSVVTFDAAGVKSPLGGGGSLENITQGVTQQAVIWGAPGNEVLRIVSNDFVLEPEFFAYINAVEAAKGGPLSNKQFFAIDAFIKAEKAAGRWSLHKRLYLPIWASAAANAVDMITATSGTWFNTGGLTHSDGYVQGGTGYLNTGVPMNVLAEDTFATLYALMLTQGGVYGKLMGGYTAGTNERWIYLGNGADIFSGGSTTLGITNATQTGIHISGRSSGVHYLKMLKQAGGSTAVMADVAAYSSPTGNFTLMGSNENDNYTGVKFTGRFGLGGLSLPMSQANADGLASNLKTLWETCTGQLIP